MKKSLFVFFFVMQSFLELSASCSNKIDSIEVYAISFNLNREFPIRKREIKEEATTYIVIKDVDSLRKIAQSLNESCVTTDSKVDDIRLLCIIHYSRFKKNKLYASVYRDIQWKQRKYKNDDFLKEILKFLPEQYTPFEFL